MFCKATDLVTNSYSASCYLSVRYGHAHILAAQVKAKQPGVVIYFLYFPQMASHLCMSEIQLCGRHYFDL